MYLEQLFFRFLQQFEQNKILCSKSSAMIREIIPVERAQKLKYGLTMLILNSNIEFKEFHVFKILQLQQNNVSHLQLYQRLASLIDKVAASLYKEHRLSTLSSYPLTEIVVISYFVAEKFPCLFYDYDTLDLLKSESILFQRKDAAEKATITKIERYNQMWIITYLLKVAYIKHVKSTACDLSVDDASSNRLGS